MHEASIAQSIVRTVLDEAEKQEATAVESIEIEIGRLTFLGIDQVEFWMKMGFQDTIAEKAEIKFDTIQGRLRCSDCDYEGPILLREDPEYHMMLPAFKCRQCGGSNVKIIKGKEAVIRRIKIVK
jgi:hydrogenase nickel incorporation protein HypA/HybF